MAPAITPPMLRPATETLTQPPSVPVWEDSLTSLITNAQVINPFTMANLMR